MTNSNGREPALPADSRPLSGNEPVLGGDRAIVMCAVHNIQMIRDLFGQNVCPECIKPLAKQPYISRLRQATDPGWFTIGSTTPVQHIVNVRGGLHPMGNKLSDNPEAQCGNCAHCIAHDWHTAVYWKCTLAKVTHGPGTDIRKKWAGCSRWEARDGGE